MPNEDAHTRWVGLDPRFNEAAAPKRGANLSYRLPQYEVPAGASTRAALLPCPRDAGNADNIVQATSYLRHRCAELCRERDSIRHQYEAIVNDKNRQIADASTLLKKISTRTVFWKRQLESQKKKYASLKAHCSKKSAASLIAASAVRKENKRLISAYGQLQLLVSSQQKEINDLKREMSETATEKRLLVNERDGLERSWQELKLELEQVHSIPGMEREPALLSFIGSLLSYAGRPFKNDPTLALSGILLQGCKSGGVAQCALTVLGEMTSARRENSEYRARLESEKLHAAQYRTAYEERLTQAKQLLDDARQGLQDEAVVCRQLTDDLASKEKALKIAKERHRDNEREVAFLKSRLHLASEQKKESMIWREVSGQLEGEMSRRGPSPYNTDNEAQIGAMHIDDVARSLAIGLPMPGCTQELDIRETRLTGTGNCCSHCKRHSLPLCCSAPSSECRQQASESPDDHGGVTVELRGGTDETKEFIRAYSRKSYHADQSCQTDGFGLQASSGPLESDIFATSADPDCELVPRNFVAAVPESCSGREWMPKELVEKLFAELRCVIVCLNKEARDLCSQLCAMQAGSTVRNELRIASAPAVEGYDKLKMMQALQDETAESCAYLARYGLENTDESSSAQEDFEIASEQAQAICQLISTKADSKFLLCCRLLELHRQLAEKYQSNREEQLSGAAPAKPLHSRSVSFQEPLLSKGRSVLHNLRNMTTEKPSASAVGSIDSINSGTASTALSSRGVLCTQSEPALGQWCSTRAESVSAAAEDERRAESEPCLGTLRAQQAHQGKAEATYVTHEDLLKKAQRDIIQLEAEAKSIAQSFEREVLCLEEENSMLRSIHAAYLGCTRVVRQKLEMAEASLEHKDATLTLEPLQSCAKVLDDVVTLLSSAVPGFPGAIATADGLQRSDAGASHSADAYARRSGRNPLGYGSDKAAEEERPSSLRGGTSIAGARHATPPHGRRGGDSDEKRRSAHGCAGITGGASGSCLTNESRTDEPSPRAAGRQRSAKRQWVSQKLAIVREGSDSTRCELVLSPEPAQNERHAAEAAALRQKLGEITRMYESKLHDHDKQLEEAKAENRRLFEIFSAKTTELHEETLELHSRLHRANVEKVEASEGLARVYDDMRSESQRLIAVAAGRGHVLALDVAGVTCERDAYFHEVGQLKKCLDDQKNELIRMSAVHAGELNGLRSDIKQAGDKLALISKALVRELIRLGDHVDTYAQSGYDNCELTNRLTELEARMTNLIESHKEKQDVMATDLRLKCGDISSLRAENDRLKMNAASLESRLDASEAQCRSLRTDLRHTESTVDDMKQHLSRARSAAEESSSRLHDAEVHAERLRNEGQAELSKVRQRMESRLSELEPLPELLKTSEQRLSTANERLASLERQNSETMVLLAELTAKAEKQSAELASWKEHYQTLDTSTQARLNQLQSKLSDSESRNTELLLTLSRREEALTHTTVKLEHSTQDSSNLARQLEQVRTDFRKAQDEAAERAAYKEKALLDRARAMEEQLASAKADLARVRRDKEEADRKLNARIFDLKERLEQSHSSNKSMQNYVQFLKSSYANVFGDAGAGCGTSAKSHPKTYQH